MDELFKQISQYPGGGGGVDVLQALAAILSSFVLSLLIVVVYRATHEGVSYSQSYAQTLVLMSVVTAVIMLIIGSNIARAFSLVGALSIIRFRSAIKEPRDVAFIFLAMATGMACGTQFYAAGATLAIMASLIAYFLFRFDVGGKRSSEELLKIVVGRDLDYHTAFQDAFYQRLKNQALLSVDAISDDALELVYAIQLKRPSDERPLLETLRATAGCRRVSLLKGLQNVLV